MVVSVAATGPGRDAEPVSSSSFASRYVRDPLPRSVSFFSSAFASGSGTVAVPFQSAARRPLVGQARRHGFHY